MTDTDILLGLVGIVGIFAVYEMVGSDARFRSIHTISWYAKHNRWLYWLIFAVFLAGGVIGAAWWYWHIHFGRIVK